MWLTRVSVSQPVFATMVMAAILVFGFYSYLRLPVEQFPEIDFPVVAVVVSYPGASPEAVESDVVKPIEEVINTLNGIDTIQSTAQNGQAMIIAMFEMEVNSSDAAQEVRDKLARIETVLPDGADKPQVLRFDPAEMPIVSLVVSSDAMAPRDLTKLTEDTIVNRLTAIQGVGSATVVGGLSRQINILADPDRLVAFNLGIGEVMNALSQDNRNAAAGSVRDGAQVAPIQVEGRLAEVQDFLDLVVARRGGQPVRLGDVATIEDSQAEDANIALINGQRALAINILKVQGANTVQVAADIRAEVAKLEAGQLPQGVHIQVITDNSVYVTHSFEAVQNMVIEGAFLAVAIVFLFLNSWRSTVITGLTLPISIIGTMIALYFLGFTLNMMTLMALSLSVGILIDDAIVVRENIMRHLHMGKSHVRAALDGTNEIGLAVLATTLSIVAVFLPVAFMDGILGRFFLQFGVTVAVAVMISLFVAFTLDPMLSSVWYDPAAHPGAKRGFLGRAVERFDRFFVRLTGVYRGILAWCLRHRITTIGVAIAMFVGSFFLVPIVGAEFVPAIDRGEFQVDVKTPPGSSLEYTTAKVRQVESLLRGFPEVERTFTTVNSGQARGENRGIVIAKMVPEAQRTRSSVDMTVPVRDALESIPGIHVTVGAASGLGNVAKPVQIAIMGDDTATLKRLSDELAGKLRQVPGLTDVETTLEEAQPNIGIRVNRELASDLGISLQQVSTTLEPMLAGKQVSDWTDPRGDSYKVTVRLPRELRDSPEVLADLPIAQSGATGSSATVTLGQVADIVVTDGPGQIDRKDLSRQVGVSANLAGVNLGEVTTPVQDAMAALSLPPGYRVTLGGDAEQLADVGGSAGSALLLAVIFIYLVLASQFGSFLQPVAIMVSLPLSLVGVMLGLLVGGSTLNMMSMIGFIMLMGLVVKNAILLVDNANQHVRAGMPLKEALLEAGTTRFRPIVMTSLAMIFGMLPLALSLHEGSSQNAPMAHAVIGGLISSTLLTLVVVPVILTWVDALGRKVSGLFPKAPDDRGTQASLPAE
jgi:HAE1 family hydrophobic/amphiphilic exporter-1